MSSTPTLTSSECPNCGATIDLSKVSAGQTQIECEYCGSMLNLPQREKLREIQAQTIVIQVSEPEAIKPAYTAPAKKSSGAGCAVIIPVIIFCIIGFVFWQSGMFDALGLSTTKVGLPGIISRERAFGSPLPLPHVNDGPQEIAYLTLADKTTQVISVDMAKQTEKWRSTTFSDHFTDIAMQADDAHVYVADGERLVALKRESGEAAWEMNLSYAISNDYQCRFNPCLRVFGNRVVARLKDGTLQAVDVATGKPAWAKQLNFTGGGLYDALGNPAAVDTDDGKNSAATFFVFDAGRGNIKTQIEPDCVPDRGSSSLRSEYPIATDDWLIAPDGKSLVVVRAGSTPCAWKFDLASGKNQWMYNADRNADETEKLPFMAQEPTLVSADGVFVGSTSSDAVMYRLDMQTGALSMLFTDARHRTEPVLAHAGMVYVIATPNFDNDKKILWAFDAISGERKWQLDLKLSHSFDKSLLQASDAGVFLAQTQWDAGKVQFDVLDAQTGASKSRQIVEMQNPSLNGQALEGNTAWLNLSSKLHEVDMTTGKVKNTWP